MFDKEIVMDSLVKIRTVIETIVFRTIEEDIPQMTDIINRMIADLSASETC